MGQSLKPVPLSKKKKTYDLYFLIKMHKTKLNCEYVLRGEQERTARSLELVAMTRVMKQCRIVYIFPVVILGTGQRASQVRQA